MFQELTKLKYSLIALFFFQANAAHAFDLIFRNLRKCGVFPSETEVNLFESLCNNIFTVGSVTQK